ncbi:calpain small subunit 1b isoform X1 [Micropterus salmoides]|uniref:calpain small subunit 1b isoform X1 n=1 Tax=Micropterus salmoides TaxID=27706 RepID=UPI0018ECD765|nr:calpain small subunit 1b isoform X1 [Micropterus salmoides]
MSLQIQQISLSFILKNVKLYLTHVVAVAPCGRWRAVNTTSASPASRRTGSADRKLIYKQDGNMFLAKTFIKGIVNVVGDIDHTQFMPSAPAPPRIPLHLAKAQETDEEAQFRRVFKQLAGDDMEVSPTELMDILNKIITKHGKLKTDGFSIESCKSMVAVMDSDSTGKLGFHEFKHLWTNIKTWQGIYVAYDEDKSGVIGAQELPKAFKAAGFPLNEDLFKLIIRRYSDENGNMDFDNFVGCLVRLDAMCRAFKTLDKDNSGSIDLDIKEWLQLTMYS